MKPVNIYLITIFFNIFLITSCSNNNQTNFNSNSKLIVSDKKIIIPIDSKTYPESGCSFYYLDRSGTEYFTYYNKNFNEIHFYDLDSLKLDFKIKVSVKGPDGIKSNIAGFAVKNIDTIFITPKGQKKIYIINHYGKIIKVIDYNNYNISDSDKYYFNHSMAYYSTPTSPLVILNNLFYINVMPNGNWNRISDQEYPRLPIAFCLDTTNHHILRLKMSFPKTSFKYNMWQYSFAYGNGYFVYSFSADNDIYVTKDFNEIRAVKAKSRFIKRMKSIPRNIDMKGFFIKTYTNPSYMKIMFDKYRKVFYRFAYPGMKISNDNVEISKRSFKYKTQFSVVVLDSDFNTICETLLPKNEYNMMDMFVSKEGLYISTNHPDNPEYNPEQLSFRLLKLDINEK